MNTTSNKIKVIHVITRFDKGGSAETTFLTLSGLDKTRYDLILITGTSPNQAGRMDNESADREDKAVRDNISSLRKNHVRLIRLSHLVRDLKPLSDLSAFIALIRIIRREKPRIVHTHTSKAGILGRWAAWFCRVPVIVHTPHGHVFWGYFGPCKTRLFIWMERWTSRITTALIAITPQERDDHLHFHIAPPEKFTVIHSGVDFARFNVTGTNTDQMKKDLDLPDGSFIVGTSGRLTPIKGHIHLLRAAVNIVARHPDIYFILMGEGELHHQLQQFAADADIIENVRFLGWRTDVDAVLSVFDIFVFPSLNEGMGKAIVEAMAMGKPIIASNVGGIPDLVVPEKTGVLIPSADSNALAEAVITLYKDASMRINLGKEGRIKAAKYSADAMVKKIAVLYEHLAGIH